MENDPTFHTDVDRGLFDKMPLESQSSSVSSLVTLLLPASPPIRMACFMAWATMRQTHSRSTASPSPTSKAKFFRTRFPLDSIESLEVISGAPPAEFGGKTSVVIVRRRARARV